MRTEWVFCPKCAEPFEIGLVKLVRNPNPKCETCTEPKESRVRESEPVVGLEDVGG